jgi:hypothetical protein
MGNAEILLYIYIYVYEGSVLGPKKYSNYIDMMHSTMRYKYVMDDRKMPLSSILKEVGSKSLYVYDLGDQFNFILEVEDIFPASDKERLAALSGAAVAAPEGIYINDLFVLTCC